MGKEYRSGITGEEYAEGKAGTERLTPYLTPVSAWALSVGTSLGWGSLVVTTNTYLIQAGPLGTVFGLLAGALLMLIISRNFHYMSGRYPEAGGVYAFTKYVYGYDRAFLVFWFLSLTYLAMFWANATSLPLFVHYFLGDMLRVGYLYSIFGYGVYLGEVLLTLFAILIVTILCVNSRAAAARLMTIMVFGFIIGILVCYSAAIVGGNPGFSPGFIPGKGNLRQVLHIALISPWAFIGFENVTHSAEEFSFRRDRLYPVLVISVITTTVIYICITLLSITAFPADRKNWLDYIGHLSSYEGIEGLPAFYAAEHYLGNAGIFLLMLSLLCLILTSLIGNLRTLGRLFCAAAKDDILPARFARMNQKHVPGPAMILVALASLPVPFLGRTSIGWIVDIATIGATAIYGFVSASALKTARKDGDLRETFTGMTGLLCMIFIGFYLLFSNLFSFQTLASETYILLIAWAVIGFFYFHRIITGDRARRFGKALIVWISLLALVVLMSMIWIGQMENQSADTAIQEIRDYYDGNAAPELLALDEDEFIEMKIRQIHRSNRIYMFIVGGLFSLALAAMLMNHSTMKQWEAQTAEERDSARKAAYRDSLTGVKSKHAYMDEETSLNQQIARQEIREFGVVVCDVNGLKHVNDTLGHKAGDEYIQAACALICDVFRHSPVFRTGGDEFVVILKGRDFENRYRLMDILHQKSEENIPKEKVVVAGGLSDFVSGEDQNVHTVMGRADQLMYLEKQELKKLGARTRD